MVRYNLEYICNQYNNMVTFNVDPCLTQITLSLSITFLGHNLHGNFVIVVSGSRFLLQLLEVILNVHENFGKSLSY